MNFSRARTGGCLEDLLRTRREIRIFHYECFSGICYCESHVLGISFVKRGIKEITVCQTIRIVPDALAKRRGM